MTINIDLDNELNNVLNDEEMNTNSLGVIIGAVNTVLLLLIIKKQKKMEQVSLDQFNAVLDRIDVATNNIATELRDIKDQVAKYGLPAEAEANIFSRLESAATTLEAIGKTNSPVTESPVTSPVTESPSTEIV